jgi:hypothetical protein
MLISNMLIALNYKGVDLLIYWPCAFKGVYDFDVVNLLKGLMYKDIAKELHVYDTQNYFNKMTINRNNVHNIIAYFC